MRAARQVLFQFIALTHAAVSRGQFDEGVFIETTHRQAPPGARTLSCAGKIHEPNVGTLMRAGLVLLLTTTFATGCADQDRVVLVDVRAPSELVLDAFTLTKVVDGRDHSVDRAVRDRPAGSTQLARAGVRVARLARTLDLYGYAMLGGQVVGEGALRAVDLTSGTDLPVILSLTSCSAVPGGPRSLCHPSGKVAGDGSDATAPDDAGVGQDALAATGPADPEADGGSSDGPAGQTSCRAGDHDAAVGEPAVPPVARGGICDSYCANMEQACQDTYGSYDRCAAICEQVYGAVGFDGDGGDNLACHRSWALRASQTPDRAQRLLSCAYADYAQLAACGMPCRAYCRIGAKICPEAFGDQTSCEKACATLTVARDDDPKMYLSCRMRQLISAVLEPARCEWAGPWNACGPCAALEFELP